MLSRTPTPAPDSGASDPVARCVSTRDGYLLSCPTCGGQRFFPTPAAPALNRAPNDTANGGPPPERDAAPAPGAAGLLRAECARCSRVDWFAAARVVEPGGDATRRGLLVSTAAGMAVVSGVLAALYAAAHRAPQTPAPLAPSGAPDDHAAQAVAAALGVYGLIALTSLAALAVALLRSRVREGKWPLGDAVVGAASGAVGLAAMFLGARVGAWASPAPQEVRNALSFYGVMVPFGFAALVVGFFASAHAASTRPRYGQLAERALTWAGYMALLAVAARGLILPMAVAYRSRHPAQGAAPAAPEAAVAGLGLGPDVVLPTAFLLVIACLVLGLAPGGAAGRGWRRLREWRRRTPAGHLAERRPSGGAPAVPAPASVAPAPNVLLEGTRGWTGGPGRRPSDLVLLGAGFVLGLLSHRGLMGRPRGTAR